MAVRVLGAAVVSVSKRGGSGGLPDPAYCSHHRGDGLLIPLAASVVDAASAAGGGHETVSGRREGAR